MSPRLSDDPVMNTRATSHLLSSRRPLRLTIPNGLPPSRAFPCTRHDADERVYTIQEEEGRPEEEYPAIGSGDDPSHSIISFETGEDYRQRDLLEKVSKLIEIFGLEGAGLIVGCP